MPNLRSYPGTSVKGPASFGVPPVPTPDSPAASVLPSVPPVDGTPKLSGIPDVDVRIVRWHLYLSDAMFSALLLCTPMAQRPLSLPRLSPSFSLMFTCLNVLFIGQDRIEDDECHIRCLGFHIR